MSLIGNWLLGSDFFEIFKIPVITINDEGKLQNQLLVSLRQPIGLWYNNEVCQLQKLVVNFHIRYALQKSMMQVKSGSLNKVSVTRENMGKPKKQDFDFVEIGWNMQITADAKRKPLFLVDKLMLRKVKMKITEF